MNYNKLGASNCFNTLYYATLKDAKDLLSSGVRDDIISWREYDRTGNDATRDSPGFYVEDIPQDSIDDEWNEYTGSFSDSSEGE